MSVADEILHLFNRAGCAAYYGEKVTQTEHALQAAHLAATAGAEPALVAAALLHDIGHLLSQLGEDAADHGIDDGHEAASAAWLADSFGEDVVAPVRLHVAAKRYLCAVDPNYGSSLSEQSQLSLKLQGGPFDPQQARHFEHERYFESAVALRRWDDQAKIPGLDVPPLEHYRDVLTLLLSRNKS